LELRPQQMVAIIQYLEEHKEILQHSLQNYCNDLFLHPNDSFTLINRVIKRLKQINSELR